MTADEWSGWARQRHVSKHFLTERRRRPQAEPARNPGEGVRRRRMAPWLGHPEHERGGRRRLDVWGADVLPAAPAAGPGAEDGANAVDVMLAIALAVQVDTDTPDPDVELVSGPPAAVAVPPSTEPDSDVELVSAIRSVCAGGVVEQGAARQGAAERPRRAPDAFQQPGPKKPRAGDPVAGPRAGARGRPPGRASYMGPSVPPPPPPPPQVGSGGPEAKRRRVTTKRRPPASQPAVRGAGASACAGGEQGG